MIEPLPEELQFLVAAEAGAPVTSDAARAAVRAKLGTTLGLAAAGVATANLASANVATAATAKVTVASAATAGGVAVKGALAIKLIAVVLGVGAVATTVAVTRDREPAQTAAVEPAPRAQPAPAPAVRVEPIEEPSASVEAPSEAPPPVVPAAVEPPKRRTKVVAPAPLPPVEPPPPSQAQLLADASRSLSLGDAAHALELIDADTQAHGAGALVEEREALRISALSALGRSAEAQEAARRLLAAYPQSIHRPLAERVLAKETP